jgi:EspG family
MKPDFELTTREFDFVWSHLELGEMPYPVDVPSNGVTMEERARLRDETFKALREKGALTEDDRVTPKLAELLRVLAEPKVSVDTVGFGEGPIRGVAASDGTVAALASLARGAVAFAKIRPTSLATSIVEVLPAGEAGTGMAIRVPHQALTKAAAGEDEDDPFGGGDERDILMANGLSDDDATTLIELAERRVRGGQFGVTTAGRATALKKGAKVRSKTMISWFDTGEGRYLMVHDGAWVSLAPADGARIAHRIEELIRKS